jgi:hypothetical protein
VLAAIVSFAVTTAPAAAQSTGAPANSKFKPSSHVRALQRAAGAGVPTKKSTNRSAGRSSGRSTAPAPRSFSPLPSQSLASPSGSSTSKSKSKHRKKHKAKAPASTYSPPATTTDPHERQTFVTKVLHQVPTGVWVGLLVLAGLAAALAAGSIVSTVRARRLERQRELLRADVGLLQSALLPIVPAKIAGVSVSAAYRPAGGPAAGGDFYDLFPLAG